MEDQKYMLMALEEAKIAALDDEVPVGCVIVKDGKVLARSHNQKERFQDVSAHAELLAIREAEEKLGTWHLDGAILYVTLEPCMMCTGAIVHSRIRQVVFGTKDPKGGALVSNIKLEEVKGINHYPDVIEGVMKEECATILKEYFRWKRSCKAKN